MIYPKPLTGSCLSLSFASLPSLRDFKKQTTTGSLDLEMELNSHQNNSKVSE